VGAETRRTADSGGISTRDRAARGTGGGNAWSRTAESKKSRGGEWFVAEQRGRRSLYFGIDFRPPHAARKKGLFGMHGWRALAQVLSRVLYRERLGTGAGANGGKVHCRALAGS